MSKFIHHHEQVLSLHHHETHRSAELDIGIAEI
jgi:hypothetical protein